MSEELHVGIGWTFETLLILVQKALDDQAAHLNDVIDLHSRNDEQVAESLRREVEEREKRYEQRFLATEKALETAFTAQEGKVTDAFAAAKEAVNKAEVLTEKRFDTAHSETDLQIGNLTQRVEIQGRRLEGLEAASLATAAGSQRASAIAFSVIGALVAIAGIVVAIVVALQ